jgi:DNA repair exonuclease SbcCD ATPase subunit
LQERLETELHSKEEEWSKLNIKLAAVEVEFAEMRTQRDKAQTDATAAKTELERLRVESDFTDKIIREREVYVNEVKTLKLQLGAAEERCKYVMQERERLNQNLREMSEKDLLSENTRMAMEQQMSCMVSENALFAVRTVCVRVCVCVCL